MRNFVVLLPLVVLGCGAGSPALRAQRPDPQIVAHWRVQDDAGVELSGLGDQACSVERGLETVCVSGLRSSMQTGLVGVVSPFMRIARDGSGEYLAHLQVRALGHGRAAAPEAEPTGPELSRLGERPDLQLWLAWTFRLFDRQGRTVLHLERLTPGPRAITDLRVDGAAAIHALQNAVLEEIAAAIDGTHLDRATADAAPSAAKH